MSIIDLYAVIADALLSLKWVLVIQTVVLLIGVLYLRAILRKL